MNSTYIIISVVALVTIIASVVGYYYFFSESKQEKDVKIKEKDALEYVNKLYKMKKESKPFSEHLAVEEAFNKKYPNVPKRFKSEIDLEERFKKRWNSGEPWGAVGILTSIM